MRYRVLLVWAVSLVAVSAGACMPDRDGDEVVVRAGKYEAIDFEGIIERAKEKVFPPLVYVSPIREDYSEG